MVVGSSPAGGAFGSRAEWDGKKLKNYCKLKDCWKTDFSFYLRSVANLEATTIECYIKGVQATSNKLHKNPYDITVDDVYRFKDSMIRKGLSKSHINNTLLAFNQWFAMVGTEAKFRTLKRDKTIPSYFEINEARALLNAADGSYKRSLVPSQCHKAVIGSTLYGALRPKEDINLRVEDFNENERTLEIKKTKTKVDDYVVLKEDCIDIILDWLCHHPTGSGWLFPIKENKMNKNMPHDENDLVRPSRRQIRRIVKHYAKKAGIKGRVYTYMLRHTLATSLAFNGCNAFYIQEQMRHKDIRTTKIYVHINKEKQRKAMDKYVPEF